MTLTGENESINLSLDEYIRRNNIKDRFGMLEMRKKELNIDRGDLDASLDLIARRNKIARGEKTGRGGKFDRFNDDNSGSEDEEEDDDNDKGKVVVKLESDIEMVEVNAENSSIRFAQEIQKMDHPDCCKFKEFKTVESEMGIKVRPQQWRLEKENLNRPPGVSRLVAVPFNEEERSRKFHNGRVEKNNKKDRKQNDRLSSAVKAGIFVEKGNFTYKLDANGEEGTETDSLIGIVRNKPNVKVITAPRHNGYNNGYRNNNNMAQPPPVNINMNWGGFFKGFKNCLAASSHTIVPMAPVTPMTSPYPSPSHSPTPSRSSTPPSTVINTSRVQPLSGYPPVKIDQDQQLKVAANDLLDFLLNKRERERKEHQAMFGIQEQLSDFDLHAGAENRGSKDTINLRFA